MFHGLKPQPLKTVLLGLCLLLSACISQTGRQTVQGDFGGVAASAEGRDLTRLEAFSHYEVCQAYLFTQQLSKMNDCMTLLWPRAKVDEFAHGSVGRFSPDMVAVLLHNLEAKKYLELGDVAAAEKHVADALAATERNPRFYMNEFLNAYTNIFTLGLNNPNAEGGLRAEEDREYARIEPLGLMAMVNILKGDKQASARHQAELRGIYDSADKTEAAQQTLLVRLWLAQSYYLEQDYEKAYDILTRDDRSGGQILFDAFSTITLVAAKPMLEPMAYVASGTNFDNMGFLVDFPRKIMLYRSAHQTGRLEVARKGYDELLADKRLRNFGNFHFRVLHERAKIALQEEELRRAEGLMAQGIELLESQRSGLESDSYKLGFIGDKLTIYADMIALLTGQNRFEDAFVYVERAKARALVDLLAAQQDLAAPNADAARLLGELEELDRKSKSGDAAPAAEPGSGTREGEGSFQTLARQLQSVAPEVASLVSVPEVSAAEIQKLLAPDETLLEFHENAGVLMAFIVDRQSVSAVLLNGKGLHTAVRRFRRDVQTPGSDRHRSSGQRLYDRLIRPLEAHLKTRRLTIVPHGSLHYLPFAALNDGDAYLVDAFDMRLLPSASVLDYLDKDRRPTLDLLALGNPDLADPAMDLPGAERETRLISKRWQGTNILLREHASEANFKKFGATARILHLASHGEFNSDDPMRSRLLLTPGDGEDGNLTVAELYGLKLNAEVVTLSACETALGEVANGDDVIGLTRGFFFAGAKSVIASLWPVADDATAHLMERFYANLTSMTPVNALRQAQLDTRKAFPHPVFWSAFQVTGSG